MREGPMPEAKGFAAPLVPEGTRQGADSQAPRKWGWLDSGVWTERMLAALGNGVKGGG